MMTTQMYAEVRLYYLTVQLRTSQSVCAHIHIPVCGEPGGRWVGLVPLLSSPLIDSQLVAGGLERVLRMEVGVVRLVLTTSCGE